jgi:hypothetical protein
MLSLSFFFTLTLSLSSLLPLTTSLPTPLGVTYCTPTTTTTTKTNTKQPPDQVSIALSSLKLTSLRILNPDPTLTRSFTYTNTSLLLTIPNPLVPPIAANRTIALRWLYLHVVPFYPRARITAISVGDDFLESSPGCSSFLIPAIRNVHLALRDLGIRRISVSTTFSFINIISTPFPPSAAEFQAPASEDLIKPLLQFLRDTNSSFLINIYPYKLYRLNSEIPIGFALFQKNPFNFRDDLITGVRYRNLFDMMIDAVISAMAVAGYENVPVIVAETGWPSSGADASEVEANPAYAEMYLKALVEHLKSGIGTPLRKEGVAEVYIYEMFDKEMKQGTTQPDRNWGILYPNMTKKYKIEFSGSNRFNEGSALVRVGLFLAFTFLHLLLQ